MPVTDEELTKWITYLEITQEHRHEEIDRYESMTPEQWKDHDRERYLHVGTEYHIISEIQRVLYSLRRGDGLPSSVDWDEI